ncbi:OLC1v1003026C1 [Oldenlandia corymbosa var. corymbosa]|uniref:OLC1v1003026C1 n=1 Tax=Oldenlandia corymbosa var. corymbosa TaxID=529605 RepID=A0AAV1D956_OLDCO|nr:OLC1v1003026C1 [Oldenlandia corymbosa var. corymbosa]
MNNGGDLSQQQQPQQPPQQVPAQPPQPQPPHPQHHHQQWLAMQQYQQQQWMSMHMQYPAAAMVMQQQMMYGGGQYVPAAAYYHHQQQQHHQQHQLYQQQQQQHHQQQQQHKQGQMQVPSEENRTIWIGDLQPWMDESYLQTCFAQSSEVISVKVIRNKQTGQSERYGFVEFGSHAAADKVLQGFNGSSMPNSDQVFRLNWAAFSMGNRRPEAAAGGGGAGAGAGVGAGSDLSIFVGDLASDVTDTLLHETFASKYPSVKGAKVVVDPNTGRSKGYGFVRFGDENERTQAMTEMNGAYCSSRPMRIGVATPKKASTQPQYSSQAVVLAGGYPSNGVPHGSQSDSDSSNTTIFVGGLDSEVTDEELRESFSQYGEVLSVKIPSGKGCGFVQFANRSNAEDAMQRLNGATIGKQTVRLSWGRNPVNKQFKMDSGYQWNGPYGRHGQNGYGYPMQQNQDRNMYAAAAANGHGGYQQPVN